MPIRCARSATTCSDATTRATSSERSFAMSTIEVKVPDIGDFKDVPVIEVFVKAGDAVGKEDPLVTLESDKATMDVPSPDAGTVRDVKVKVGDKVSEGSVLLTLETAAAAAAPSPPPQPKSAAAQPQARPPRASEASPAKPATPGAADY